MPLTVHHLQYSQSERIPWLCEELGLTYDLKLYQRAPLFAPPDYQALHHSGTAPVIQDGDVTLAESGACIEYISRIHANGRLFVDPTDPAYPEFVYWWHWANGTFQAGLTRAFSLKAAGVGAEHQMMVMAETRRKRGLDALEKRLEGNEWLAGSQFSVADVMLIFSLTTMRLFFPFSLEGYGNVLKYLKRVSEREAYQKAMKKSDPQMELVLGAAPPEKTLV